VAAKSLASLIRVGKWTVDEKRRALAALYAREEEVVAAIRAMDEQLEAERQAAAADATGAGFTFSQFYDRHMQRRAALVRQRDALRDEIELARDDLSEAYRQLKSYEQAEKQRLQRERAEADRKEQIELDEIGQTLHRRRSERG